MRHLVFRPPFSLATSLAYAGLACVALACSRPEHVPPPSEAPCAPPSAVSTPADPRTLGAAPSPSRLEREIASAQKSDPQKPDPQKPDALAPQKPDTLAPQKPDTAAKSRPAREDATKEPELRRFVVARDVEAREPVGDGPLYAHSPLVAFLEFQNPSASELGVLVTFQHESGKRVGFIELSVPARSPRFRTWGRTQHIDLAGRWTAIVQGDDGRELSRQDFLVEPSDDC